MELHKVSQKELLALAQQKGAIRTGSTVNPKRRAQDYARDGYRGNMYIAKTTNMKKAEDKLLNASPARHNQQRASNHQEQPGYVYGIKGRKMN